MGAQRPRLLSLPEGVASLAAGRDAIEFAASLGVRLDDWQEWLVCQLLAERHDGSLASGVAVVIVPRQNGKNMVLAVVELYGLCIIGLRRQVHSAHLGDTAAEHMKLIKDLILDNDLDVEHGGYLQVYESNGKERVVNVETRGELSFNTRTKSTKRGTPPQRIVLDEALFLDEPALRAMVPALAAQSMDPETSPQVIVTSSAPLPESQVLHRLRRAGLNGGPRLFLAEWSCEVGCDITDRDNWYAANPGLGVRISEEFVADMEFAVVDADGFAIERLGVVFGEDGGNTELPEWASCFDGMSQMVGAAPVLAVDVSPDLKWTSIAVAGPRADGLGHIELVEHLPGTGDAVAMVAARIAGSQRASVHLDPRSPAGGLVPALQRTGVTVVEIGTTDLVRGCAELKHAVATGQLRHRGQAPLDAAVTGAAVRTVGDGWAWARRSSQVVISPLVAVTLAWHAWASMAPKRVRFISLDEVAKKLEEREKVNA